MISQIHLRHFKCFENLDLSLGRLTLLTGRNATGKSSVIQSLLLLHQNLMPIKDQREMALNGESVSLGSFGDVLDMRSGRSNFGIGISKNEYRMDWSFESKDRTALTAAHTITLPDESGSTDVELFPAKAYSSFNQEHSSNLKNTLRHILHVSTERIGPRETYQADPESSSRLGAKGEYTAWFLHRNGESAVHDKLRQPDVPPGLLRQTEAWMATFFPGASFQVERIKDTNLVSLRFRTSSADEFHRPGNVGYGLSHLLPVLVGGLGIAPGELLIIENPEAHLHPSAQAEIGIFLAMVAATGAQVILESHSDHVLNGIRRAVKSGILKNEDAAIHYFNSRDTPPQVISPMISKQGVLDQWPTGFFDQYEKDLEQLTSWE